MPKKTAYYVIGDDPNGTFDRTLDWVLDPSAPSSPNNDRNEGYDVQLIRPKPGQSFEDAVKIIEPGSQVSFGVHRYSDGTFLWNKGERVSNDRENLGDLTLIAGDKPVPEVNKDDPHYRNSVETPFEVRLNENVRPGGFSYEEGQSIDSSMDAWHKKHPGMNALTDMSDEDFRQMIETSRNAFRSQSKGTTHNVLESDGIGLIGGLGPTKILGEGGKAGDAEFRELSTINHVVHSHSLVTERHQSNAAAEELKGIASRLGLFAISTSEGHLSESQIEDIQRALRVTEDGKVGPKTLAAMEEKIQALPTPTEVSAAHVQRR